MSLDQLDVMRKCDQLADLIVGPKEDFEAHLLACGEDWLLSSDIIDRALGESGLLALTSDECTALARSSSALRSLRQAIGSSVSPSIYWREAHRRNAPVPAKLSKVA
jgi:hypothetical protein